MAASRVATAGMAAPAVLLEALEMQEGVCVAEVDRVALAAGELPGAAVGGRLVVVGRGLLPACNSPSKRTPQVPAPRMREWEQHRRTFR